MGEEWIVRFKDESIGRSDLILHEGDMDLSSYKWQFGRTPPFSEKVLDSEWSVEDPEEDAAEVETSKRPDIVGHQNNKEFKMPSNHLLDPSLLSLKPSYLKK